MTRTPCNQLIGQSCTAQPGHSKHQDALTWCCRPAASLSLHFCHPRCVLPPAKLPSRVSPCWAPGHLLQVFTPPYDLSLEVAQRAEGLMHEFLKNVAKTSALGPPSEHMFHVLLDCQVRSIHCHKAMPRTWT